MKVSIVTVSFNSAPTIEETIRSVLEQEGVEFDAKDRVDLKKYGWSGSNNEDNVEPSQPNLF